MLQSYRLLAVCFVLFSIGACSRSSPTGPNVFELTIDELENRVAANDAQSLPFKCELLTREILPSRAKEISDQLIETLDEESFAWALSFAWAAKSKQVQDPDLKAFAFESANRSIELAERSSNRRALANAIFVKARHHLGTREFTNAFRQFDELRDLTFDHPSLADFYVRGLNGMGAVAMLMDAHARAQNLFERALNHECMPSLADPRAFAAINLGLLQWRKREYEKAVASLDESRVLAQKMPSREWIFTVIESLIICNLKAGHNDAALDLIGQANENRKEVPERKIAFFRAYRGLASARLGTEDPEAVIDDVEEAISSIDLDDPLYPVSRIAQAEIQTIYGNYEAAREIVAEIRENQQDGRFHRIEALVLEVELETKAGNTNAALEASKLVQDELQARYVTQLSKEYEMADMESEIARDRFSRTKGALVARGDQLRKLILSMTILCGIAGLLGWTLFRRSQLSRRSAEVRHVKTVEEKAELVEELAEMESALQQKRRLEALGELTGGVAHDFNNLLTVIMSSNELLSLKLPDERSEITELIEQSCDAANLGSKITRQLLAFSRQQPLNPEIIDIGTHVREIEGLLARSISPLNCLSIEYDDLPLRVRIDTAQLTTSLINLCSNARDAIQNRANGRISVRMSSMNLNNDSELEPGCYCRIVTEDNGAGMNDLELARACEPFFSTKQQSSGTGLGLSTVHGFVKQSGGDLRIKSTKGLGTSVEILLPFCKEKLSHKTSEPHLGRGQVGSILIVDDDPQIRKSLERMTRLLGVEVSTASNLDEALAYLESNPLPDMLLSDIRMQTPKEGLELASQAKKLYPQLRILLMSGFYDNAGIDQFPVLRKPFSKAKLVQTLELESQPNC